MRLVETHARDPVQEVQRLFGRTLSIWASDMLRLRAKGLDRPGYRSYLGSRVVGVRAFEARAARRAA